MQSRQAKIVDDNSGLEAAGRSMREGLEGLGELRLPAGKRQISWPSLDLPGLEDLRSIRLTIYDLATST
jgi:hypothetical protein